MYEGLAGVTKAGVSVVAKQLPALAGREVQTLVFGESPMSAAYDESAFDDVQGVVVSMLQERLVADQESIVNEVIGDDWMAFEREMKQKMKDNLYKSQADLEADIQKFYEAREPELERAMTAWADETLEAEFPWDEVDKRLEKREAEQPGEDWLNRANAVYSALVSTMDVSVARSYLAQLVAMTGTAPMATFAGINLQAHLEGLIMSAQGLVDELLAVEAEG
jgi:hypothetical protein